jgi:segregation and condensation protein B|tara:strand:- start:1608 stop:2306 length:699 start_codon:yes stop_codon:yes gene_type:complete
MSDSRFENMRLLEALLFSASAPQSPKQLARFFPEGTDLIGMLMELSGLYANRGVVLEQIEDLWAFRTAADVAPLMSLETMTQKKMTRAALETLAIIAFHQPITRGEIEEVRGVALSKGTLDTLLEAQWVRPRGRRRTPGRPLTWGTTTAFLDHFNLESLESLPGLEELKAAGLMDSRPAITSLGERGLLPAMEAAEAPLDDDDDAAQAEFDLLDEDFGEDLVDDDEGSPARR